jgi:peptidoglycan/xylan/chitin deacetylase (PgdA/CDA1 family)
MKVLVRLASIGLLVLGAAVPAAAATPFTLRVPVLMYHHITCWPGEPWNNAGLYVCPEAFDAQMARLKANGWQTVTTAQLAEALYSGTCLPPKTFVVTFDDGWESQYIAAQTLERYGYVGSYFPTVGRIFTPEGEPPFRRHYDLSQAQDLIDRGHLVGSHTMNHKSLSSGTTAKYDAQIAAAQQWLNDNGLGHDPLTFVYPYGSYSAAAIAYLDNYGYKMAFTTEAGRTHSTDNPLASPRVRVSRSTTASALLTRLNRQPRPC